MQKLGAQTQQRASVWSQRDNPRGGGPVDQCLCVRCCVCCLVFVCPRFSFCLVPIQAISWSPSSAVRIIDQRALPEAEITRDLESAESVADAIKQLQVRGAPLLRIAAAIGLVAGTRDRPPRPRGALLARAGGWS